jgi:hypothetical protein
MIGLTPTKHALGSQSRFARRTPTNPPRYIDPHLPDVGSTTPHVSYDYKRYLEWSFQDLYQELGSFTADTSEYKEGIWHHPISNTTLAYSLRSFLFQKTSASS